MTLTGVEPNWGVVSREGFRAWEQAVHRLTVVEEARALPGTLVAVPTKARAKQLGLSLESLEAILLPALLASVQELQAQVDRVLDMRMDNVRIVDLRPDDEKRIDEAAILMMDAFRENPDYCPDLETALEEIRELFDPDCIGRVAVDEQGTVLGLIGGRPHYYGHAWELHPLAVRPEHQRKGIGRALVADLEERVRERGALTFWLGTDDEDDRTTLSAVDLYPNPLEHLARIRNLRGHPYEFYRKMGFVIVGVIPDANGWGKPDIFMAKRVGSRNE